MKPPVAHSHLVRLSLEERADLAHELAFLQNPSQWWEGKIPAFVGAVVVIGIVYVVQQRFIPPPYLWLSVLSFSLAFAGYIADIISTQAGMHLKARFDRLGCPFPGKETGIFLPDYPTLRQEVISINNALYLLCVVAAFYIPAAGFGAAVQSFGAAMSNLQGWRRDTWVIEALETWPEEVLNHYVSHHQATKKSVGASLPVNLV